MAAGVTVYRTRSGGGISENPRTVTADATAPLGADVFDVSCSSGTGVLTSLADNAGNGTHVNDAQTSDAGSVGRAFLTRSFAIAHAITTGVNTLALTTGAGSFKGIGAWYMTGGTIGALDKTNVKKTGTGTAITSNATATLTQANEIAIALFFFAGSPTFTEQVGWNNVFGAGNYLSTTSTIINIAAVWTQTAATTALSPTATLGTSNVWGTICATYTWTDAGATVLPNMPNVVDFAVARASSY